MGVNEFIRISTMATVSTNFATGTTAGRKKAGTWFFALMEEIATYSPTYREILRYNALSDAELAERGMTRADVVQRVFGSRLGI
jgi:hypothetical protein